MCHLEALPVVPFFAIARHIWCILCMVLVHVWSWSPASGTIFAKAWYIWCILCMVLVHVWSWSPASGTIFAKDRHIWRILYTYILWKVNNLWLIASPVKGIPCVHLISALSLPKNLCYSCNSFRTVSQTCYTQLETLCILELGLSGASGACVISQNWEQGVL